MIDLKIIREKPEEIQAGIESRGVSFDINKIFNIQHRFK